MNGFKHTGAAAGASAGDYSTIDGDETLTGDKTLSGAVDLTGTWDIGSTQVTSTAAELNIMDGSATTQATVTLAGTDGVVISDGDVMKQCLVSDFPVYARDVTETLTNKTLTSPNINEAVALTATSTELNKLDGTTILQEGNTWTETNKTGLTLTSSLVIIDNITVGTVAVGDIVTVNVSIAGTKGATSGSVVFSISETVSSVAEIKHLSSVILGHVNHRVQLSGDTFEMTDSIIFKVTVAGNLIIQLGAYSKGSDTTSATVNFAAMSTTSS